MSARELPLVWVLTGRRVGDSTQVIGLAESLTESLGWPFELKQLSFDEARHKGPNLLMGASVKAIVRAESDELAPPWPDLVLSIGRRIVPVARWVRRQSGERCKLVHLGRPRLPRRYFDLLVVTPQYRMRPAPNVLRIPRPIHRVNAQQLARGREQWSERIAPLPRPRIGVLVGGNAKPFRFDEAAARELGARARELVWESGGSLLVTTSFRTRAESADALEAELEGLPTLFYRWREGAVENPYFGFLAHADSFVVTGESASMMAEAAETGRLVRIFPLPRDAAGRQARLERLYAQPLVRRALEWLNELGLLSIPRDTESIQRELIESGAACFLGQPEPTRPASGDGSTQLAVARIRQLMGL